MRALSARVLIGAIVLAVPGIAPAQSEAISEISKVYNETEANLQEMRHLSFKEFNLEGEFTNTLNAWFDLTGDLRKVSSDGISSHGDLLEEFFINDGKLVFYFSLGKHTPFVEKAKTTVKEERIYFHEGKVIRNLTKKGVFAEGAKHDMSKIKNLPKTVAENPFAEFNSGALEIAHRLEAMADPEADQAGTTQFQFPHGSDYRLIEGSVSPNARYAIGWAPNARHIDWNEYTEDGESFIGDYGKCSNYLVDLTTQRRIAKLPAKHFGDKQLYNHIHCTFEWSSDSTQFMQTVHAKWHTESCTLGRIDKAGKLLPPIDLLANVSNSARSLIKKQKHPVYEKHGKDLLIEIGDAELDLGYGGSLTANGINVAGAKAGEENSSFRARVRLGKTGEVTDIEILADDG